ncbi:hypothetical protein GOL99_17785 [Sinorhizobium medicae]|nr:hypothetical protein [Sinorhizobium medicae]
MAQAVLWQSIFVFSGRRRNLRMSSSKEGNLAGDDDIDEKLLDLQSLLKRLWKAGAVSESTYRTRLTGIWRATLFWRNAGRSAPWILNQLAAVEDELMAELPPKAKSRRRS